MTLLAVVTGDVIVDTLLATELLKKAALDNGDRITVRAVCNGRTIVPDTLRPKPGDRAILVGGGEDVSLDVLDPLRVSLAEVLADAPAVLARVPAANDRVCLKIVAVTSCPTGIAHTFMAAEGLKGGARQLGHEIKVETQGSVGACDALSASDIAEADFVIIAADREVERARFAGKRVFLSSTKPAIANGADVIERAAAEAVAQGGSVLSEVGGAAKGNLSASPGPYRHLMNGVSFMLPFVTAGGLLIALAFAFGGINANQDSASFAHALFQIGATGAFKLIVPALAGYIAYSIADRPGLAPGMIGGLLAADLGAGFLGGIAAGFIAGYATSWLSRLIRLPKQLEGLKPVLLLPLAGTLITGLLMIYAVGAPVAAILSALTNWLNGLQGSSAASLGLLLGTMAAFDMGGPVNKAGYAFSTGLIASGVYSPMAATMAAGMVPPLAAALAAWLAPAGFAAEEREASGAAAVLGLAYITEGAIPFAARDPFRVIPSFMLGSACAGAIAMWGGVGLHVPHGGIFVLAIPGAVSGVLKFTIALGVGVVVSSLALITLKRASMGAPVDEAGVNSGNWAARRRWWCWRMPTLTKR